MSDLACSIYSTNIYPHLPPAFSSGPSGPRCALYTLLLSRAPDPPPTRRANLSAATHSMHLRSSRCGGLNICTASCWLRRALASARVASCPRSLTADSCLQGIARHRRLHSILFALLFALLCSPPSTAAGPAPTFCGRQSELAQQSRTSQ